MLVASCLCWCPSVSGQPSGMTNSLGACERAAWLVVLRHGRGHGRVMTASGAWNDVTHEFTLVRPLAFELFAERIEDLLRKFGMGATVTIKRMSLMWSFEALCKARIFDDAPIQLSFEDALRRYRRPGLVFISAIHLILTCTFANLSQLLSETPFSAVDL